MGMTARTRLTIVGEPVGSERGLALIRDIRGKYEDAAYMIAEDGSPSYGEGYWRSAEACLKEWTLENQGFTIQLDEEGNYDGAFYNRAYFRDGKMQRTDAEVRVEYPPFDETKLA